MHKSEYVLMFDMFFSQSNYTIINNKKLSHAHVIMDQWNRFEIGISVNDVVIGQLRML